MASFPLAAPLFLCLHRFLKHAQRRRICWLVFNLAFFAVSVRGAFTCFRTNLPRAYRSFMRAALCKRRAPQHRRLRVIDAFGARRGALPSALLGH